MHNSMKATIKLSAAAVQDAHCRHAARHGLQAPGSITPLSAAAHSLSAALQRGTKTRQKLQHATLYDKIRITVPEQNTRVKAIQLCGLFVCRMH